MNSIGKNDALLSFMASNEIYILSAEILNIEIKAEFSDKIVVDFRLIQNGQHLRIIFSNLLEYAFYSKHGLHHWVENLKFFKVDDRFYISLDPYDEN